jgi:antirestriction protein ArdC
MTFKKTEEEKEKPEGGDESDSAESLNDDDEDETAKEVIRFKEMPVFRVEDTEGAPLDYEERVITFDVESLPFIEVAKSLGVTVEAGLTLDGSAGWYKNSKKFILMGTANPVVFLHELSHAVDFALPNRKEHDYAYGEVVAELSAAFLASLYGIKYDIAQTKSYIESWSGKGHVAFKVVDALARVEEIYHFIENSKNETRKIKPARRRKAASPRKVEQASVVETFGLFAGPGVKERTQTFNPKTGKWVKRDEKSLTLDLVHFSAHVKRKQNFVLRYVLGR